jgi:hypothetical protein
MNRTTSRPLEITRPDNPQETLMARNPTEPEKLQALATYADVKGVLGDMDDAKMTSILALRPTITDIEEASMWLSGDIDIFGRGRPLKDVPGQIVALLTADEEENAPRSR